MESAPKHRDYATFVTPRSDLNDASEPHVHYFECYRKLIRYDALAGEFIDMKLMRVMGHTRRRDGYVQLIVIKRTYLGRSMRFAMAHRVALFLTRGPPPSLEHACEHIDKDRSNNRASNLRWSTTGDSAIDDVSDCDEPSEDGDELNEEDDAYYDEGIESDDLSTDSEEGDYESALRCIKVYPNGFPEHDDDEADDDSS